MNCRGDPPALANFQGGIEMAKVEIRPDGMMLQDGQTADEWNRAMFESQWCAECGRDHRHHTVVLNPFGLFHAYCDLEPIDDGKGGLVCNPEGYPDY